MQLSKTGKVKSSDSDPSLIGLRPAQRRRPSLNSPLKVLRSFRVNKTLQEGVLDFLQTI